MSSCQFDNLPLVEVEVTLVNRSLVPFNIKSIFNCWQIVKDTFSEIENTDLIRSHPAGPLIGQLTAGHPMGANLFDPISNISASLQRQNIVVAWRRTSLTDGEAYPGYSLIRARLDAILSAIRYTMGDSFLGFQIASMAYQNVIEVDSAPDFALVRSYLRPTVVPELPSGESLFQGLDVGWSLGDQVDYRLQAIPVVLSSDQTQNGLQFRNIAGVVLSEGEDEAMALDRIHDSLNDMFPKVISPTAMEKWGYSNANIRN